MQLEHLGDTRSLLREVIEAVPGAVYAKDREGRILLGNAGFAEAVGWPGGGYLGKTDIELLADKDLARAIMDNDRRIMAARRRQQIEETLRSRDGELSCWLSTKTPFTDEAGEVAGLVGVSINITARKRLEERERLLAREIEHRNKNLLSVVQSVVRLTQASTVDGFRDAVIGRLEALDRVQGVLRGDQGQHVDLRDLLLKELAAYGPKTSGRVRLAGPPVSLGAGAAQPLAMAVHELATNAAKYGALSGASGSLEVNWICPEGAAVQIEWKEIAGRPISPPGREGFGARLVRTVIEQQLSGALTLSWEPNGLRCRIALPPEVG